MIEENVESILHVNYKLIIINNSFEKNYSIKYIQQHYLNPKSLNRIFLSGCKKLAPTYIASSSLFEQ